MILVHGLLADCIDTGFHQNFWRCFLACSFLWAFPMMIFLDADTENRLVDTVGQERVGRTERIPLT